MTTPLTDLQPTARKSWSALTTQARQNRSPGDIDVRCSVRAALEAEARGLRQLASRRSVLDDLTLLSQNWGMRFALGGFAVLAAVSLWNGLDAATGFDIAIDLQGLLMPSL